VIVGTAGHIDHGKTTLVRALTGVDTDRLPEEKERGISIELGYAYLDAGAAAERIGFIDVPGHERLVATMLAGATGIDYALLLVAADDGVMPQTREHLAVLSLLGVPRGAIVVTKTDRASDARIAEVCLQARELVAGTPLAAAPLAIVSAQTGTGIDALREQLVEAALHEEASRGRHDPGAGFRLAIDRVFTLAGAGTVVTGTAHAGSVAVGDTLSLAPSARGVSARVRSIHAQNAAVSTASSGQRVALALAGVERDEIARGQWLVSPAVALMTHRLDARVDVWRGESKALRSGAIVHLHLGACDVLASVAVLDVRRPQVAQGAAKGAPGDAIEPGASGRVQLVLRAPVAAWRGDRIVLRDASATRTVAGGVVLDPSAPARYRRTAQRLAMLDAAGLDRPAARLAALLDVSPEGVDVAAWHRAEGAMAEPSSNNSDSRADARLHARAGEAHWALASSFVASWQARLVETLGDFHRQRPDEPGPDAGRLRRLVAPRMTQALWRALLEAAIAAGQVGQRGAQCFLPQHDAVLSAAEQRIVQKVWPRLLDGGFDPPWVRTLADDVREPEALVRTALLRAAQRGELHQVVRDLYYPPPTLARAAALVRAIAERDERVSAAAFRDASGLGRKRAIQIVEYFDRVGLLRRVGDVHRLRAECELFGERSSA
jgi:selenocysteine-specific elongation factor